MRFLSLLLIVATTLPVAWANPLEDISRISDMTRMRASSYDRSGDNTDNVTSFAPGETHVLLDTDGPGRVTHMWITLSNFMFHPTLLRDLVIRMYWEESDVPSVEVPFGDFFGLGHNAYYQIESAPVCVGQNPRAFNCYWPMPFHKHARIEIYNGGNRSVRRIYYNVDYELGRLTGKHGLFHAVWQRNPEEQGESEDRDGLTTEGNYVMLEAEGRGQYMGCFLFVDSQPGAWWGEGDEMIQLDGEKTPSIIGTGTEDYFGNAWGFDETFTYDYYGLPLLQELPNEHKLTTAYRFHIPDPVYFKKSIRVTLETLYDEDKANDYASTAFWYQEKPNKSRPPLPEAKDRYSHAHPHDFKLPDKMKVCGTLLEPVLREGGVDARSITAARRGFEQGGWLRVVPDKDEVSAELTFPAEGVYRVELKPVRDLVKEGFQVSAGNNPAVGVTELGTGQESIPYLDLGTVDITGGTLLLRFYGNTPFGVDSIKLERVQQPGDESVPESSGAPDQGAAP